MSRIRLRGLYAITDEKLLPRERFETDVEAALKGGARIIQYRDKSNDNDKQFSQATRLRELCDQYHALLIINDDIQLAKYVRADGVHLGEHDANIEQARKNLGDDAIIGVSCYNQLRAGIEAENEGADYVAFGSMYSSPTKPNARKAELQLLKTAKLTLKLPVCAIGGIDINNAADIVQHDADMIAVISGVFAQQNIERAAQQLAALY